MPRPGTGPAGRRARIGAGPGPRRNRPAVPIGQDEGQSAAGQAIRSDKSPLSVHEASVLPRLETAPFPRLAGSPPRGRWIEARTEARRPEVRSSGPGRSTHWRRPTLEAARRHRRPASILCILRILRTSSGVRSMGARVRSMGAGGGSGAAGPAPTSGQHRWHHASIDDRRPPATRPYIAYLSGRARQG
jgi:hypothetical protein